MIPVLNESKTLRAVLHTFCSTAYPNLVDILVIDGGSTDDTLAIVEECRQKDSRIQLLSNPRRFQCYALNIALENCRGDVYLRADGHCCYAPDYIERCVETLLSTGAANVGGAQRHIAETPVQLAVALSTLSHFATGGARYRNKAYEGWAETVFLGCFWTANLRDIGGYSVEMRTNEDYFANVMLRRMVTTPRTAGKPVSRRAPVGGIYISQRIQVWYHPRDQYSKLFVQYWRYGRGRFLTSIQHGIFLSRGSAPAFALCAAVILTGIASMVVPPAVAVCYGAGLSIIAADAARIVLRSSGAKLTEYWRGVSEPPAMGVIMILRIVCVVLIVNCSHAIGFLYQCGRLLWFRKAKW